jgi:ubiquinone/menaquinone biosynthesis C-methylase UbiE
LAIIDYHLCELEVALNATDERRIVPTLLDSEKTILDVGCGIGQTFIALNCTDRTCIGLDVDKEVLRYGMTNYGHRIQFVCSDAKAIPTVAETFDLVFCRVSLPYTNIPTVIREIRRVLKTPGRVWMTLHSRDTAINYLKESVSPRLTLKRFVHVLYILLNGYLLKYFGIVVPFVNGKFESWQDSSTMEKLLRRNGFEASTYKVGRHTVIEGHLK